MPAPVVTRGRGGAALGERFAKLLRRAMRRYPLAVRPAIERNVRADLRGLDHRARGRVTARLRTFVERMGT